MRGRDKKWRGKREEKCGGIGVQEGMEGHMEE